MNGRMTRVFLAVCILALGAVAVAQAELGWTFSWNQSLANMASRDVALDDLDGDGDLDAYVANDNGEYDQIYINQGGSQGGIAGIFSAVDVPYTYNSKAVALGKLNGQDDDSLDAVVVHEGWPHLVYFNDGTGTLVNSGQELDGLHGQDVALGDLDHNGALDIYVASGGLNLYADFVWLNDGDGNFPGPRLEVGGTPSNAVALGDLDGNGTLDAFVAVNGEPNRVWLNDGNANFTLIAQELGVGLSSSNDVALGDLNNDGRLDAVVANNGANEIWLNEGTGSGALTFTGPLSGFGDGQSSGVALGDVDGDGDVDVVIADANETVPNKVWLNDGSGGLSDSELAVGLGATQAVALGTLDATASLDLFVANHGVESEVWIKTTPTNVGLRQMEASAAVAWWAPVLGALLVLTLFSWRRQERRR